MRGRDADGRGRAHAIERAVGAWLVAALPLRVLLDLGPGAVGRAAAGLWGASLVVCAVVFARSWRRHPLRWPLGLFLVLLSQAALRTVTTAEETLRLLLLYTSPIAFGLAVGAALDAHSGRWMLRLTACMGLIPVGLSLAALAGGQPEQHVLHGYPRLLGPYAGHHPHAVAMGALCVVGGWLVLVDRPRWTRGLGLILAVGAAICLWFTYVRTVALFVGLVALVGLLAARRFAWAGLLAAAALVAAVAHPTLRDRFADVFAVLTLTEPAGGWGAVGSHRFAIWSDSWQRFVDEGPIAWALGLGLGGHRTLHKALDPHNEYLTLWYQLGVLGPLAYLWMLGLAARDAWRRRGSAEGALVVGLIAAVIPTAALSNDFLPRAFLASLVWGCAGVVWAGAKLPDHGIDQGGEDDGGADPDRLGELGGDVRGADGPRAP